MHRRFRAQALEIRLPDILLIEGRIADINISQGQRSGLILM
jgi:hypothetical protein